MAGEYRGGEAFTPSVMEGKRKPRTAEQKNAERSKKTRSWARVYRKKFGGRFGGKHMKMRQNGQKTAQNRAKTCVFALFCGGKRWI